MTMFTAQKHERGLYLIPEGEVLPYVKDGWEVRPCPGVRDESSSRQLVGPEDSHAESDGAGVEPLVASGGSASVPEHSTEIDQALEIHDQEDEDSPQRKVAREMARRAREPLPVKHNAFQYPGFRQVHESMKARRCRRCGASYAPRARGHTPDLCRDCQQVSRRAG